MKGGWLYCPQHALPWYQTQVLDLCQGRVKAACWVSSTQVSVQSLCWRSCPCMPFWEGRAQNPHLSIPQIQLSPGWSSHPPFAAWTPTSPLPAAVPLPGAASQYSPGTISQQCTQFWGKRVTGQHTGPPQRDGACLGPVTAWPWASYYSTSLCLGISQMGLLIELTS